LEAVDVGCAKTKFAGAGAELDALGGVDFLELLCNVLGSVRGAVVDDDEFPVEITVEYMLISVHVVR
jgi:hypothetical protein